MKFLINLLFFSVITLGINNDALAALSDISRIFHQAPSLNQLEVCQGGGCEQINQLSISEAEWNSVAQLYKAKANNASEERLIISQAIGKIEQIVGAKNGTATDRAGTFVVMGVVAVLSFHILVNVGMVVGFMPVTGIPLPSFFARAFVIS